MATNIFSSEFLERDPTWKRAHEIAQSHIKVPTHVWRLLQNAWNRQYLGSREFIRVLGFSRLNISCLFNAAEISTSGKLPTVGTINQALDVLGSRLTALVLAINMTCHSILKKKPPSFWHELFQEMMTRIEIGYRFGSRVSILGVEGGMLSGFVQNIGDGLLLAEDQKAFKEWRRRIDPNARQLQVEYFGCEGYQVTAFALQRLGFGTDVAVGVVLAFGDLDSDFIKITDEIQLWQAACLWVQALREGRSYPADPNVRRVFPQLIPKPGEKNLQLESLYAEIAKARSSGSNWTWHLPKSTYEETQLILES